MAGSCQSGLLLTAFSCSPKNPTGADNGADPRIGAVPLAGVKFGITLMWPDPLVAVSLKMST